LNSLAHKNQIRELARRGGLSHAWLLAGPEGRDRTELAAFLAAAMLCGSGDKSDVPCGSCAHCRKVGKGIHPDLIRLERLPDKKEYVVDQIRELAKEAYVLPNEAERKVFIIKEAELLNIYAQNALLKLLEEPPSYASFILMAANPGSLFATVRSRCVEMYVPAGDKTEFSELSLELASAFAAGDGLSLAKACAKAEKLEREAFDRLIDELFAVSAGRAKAAWARDERRRCLRLCALAERLRELRGVNVGAGHCLGLMLSEL
jgi:DNA polymerase III delta prime subunit